MSKLVCQFSGWCEIDTDDVKLEDCHHHEIKSASQWMAENNGELPDGLMLCSFAQLQIDSTGGEYTELDLSIEEN